jgi:hypothetical protein
LGVVSAHAVDPQENAWRRGLVLATVMAALAFKPIAKHTVTTGNHYQSITITFYLYGS